jgi:magnesium-transporting ATPase (P-type)
VLASEHPVLLEAARIMALCNDAALHQSSDGWRAEGDPMEAALLALAGKLSGEGARPFADWTRTDAIPFDAAHRYMAVLVHDHEGRARIDVKGAPEAVLALCADQLGADGHPAALDTGHWHAQVERLAGAGQRVLALAVRTLPQAHTVLNTIDLEGRLTLVGLVGLIDPPRPEAIAAPSPSATSRRHPGEDDHRRPRRHGAGHRRPDGHCNSKRVLTGAELDGLDDAALAGSAAVRPTCSRASRPEHKLRLVTALQTPG